MHIFDNSKEKLSILEEDQILYDNMGDQLRGLGKHQRSIFAPR